MTPMETRGGSLVLAFGTENIRWIVLLLGMILSTVVGVLFPNFLNQAAKPRAHNGAKLLNECLARHQLAYLFYFSNMYVGGNFDPKYTWTKSLVWWGILTSLIFYGYGLYSTTVQDKKIRQYHHECTNEESCPYRPDFLFGLRLWGLNLVFAIVSAAG